MIDNTLTFYRDWQFQSYGSNFDLRKIVTSRQQARCLFMMACVYLSARENGLAVVNINVNVNLYSASSKSASNALNVTSTDQKETFSVYDENSQFACPAHANCFGTSSMSLVQRQRRCDSWNRGTTSRWRLAERRCCRSATWVTGVHSSYI